MPKYKVNSNIKNNGQTYEAGSTIEFDESVANSLLKDGVISELDGEDYQEEVKQDPEAEDKAEEGTKEDTGAEDKAEDEQEDGKEENKADEQAEGEEIAENGREEREPAKSQYKVVKGLEYPRGTVHAVDAIIELTEAEAGEFAEGLIEKVEVGTEDGEDL